MTIPVNTVNGIGPKTTEYLKTKNVTTVAELVKFGVTNLSLAPSFNPGRATTAINEAKKLISGSSTSKTKKSDKKDKKNKKTKDKKKKDKKNKKKDKKNKK